MIKRITKREGGVKTEEEEEELPEKGRAKRRGRRWKRRKC